MNCQELSDLLLEHAAGGLPWHVTLLLRTHAALCPCCRHLVTTYKLTNELSADLRTSEVPAAVADAIRDTLASLAKS